MSMIKLRNYFYSSVKIVKSCSLGAFLILISFCNPSDSKNNNETKKTILGSTDSNFYNIANSGIAYRHYEESSLSNNSKFPYDLTNPATIYKLPEYLKEISGVSYYKKDKIACIQDEKANIYILNLENEKIVSKDNFGGDADYEDIAVVGKTAFVLRNSGEIYKIEKFKDKDRKVKKYKTPLSGKNDTEGLAFDLVTNSLFIACKGSPSIDKENIYKGYKAIYRFDLEEKKLIKTPHFLIDLKNIDTFRDNSNFTKISIKIAKKLLLIKNEVSFSPSGIAIHPFLNEIYIISSIKKMLMVLDRNGKVLDLKNLDNKLFLQPEGICFSPQGDLFISNEGRGGKGYILKFNYLKNE